MIIFFLIEVTNTNNENSNTSRIETIVGINDLLTIVINFRGKVREVRKEGTIKEVSLVGSVILVRALIIFRILIVDLVVFRIIVVDLKRKIKKKIISSENFLVGKKINL